MLPQPSRPVATCMHACAQLLRPGSRADGDDESAGMLCQALLNLSLVPELRPALHAARVPAVLRPLCGHADMRVADAAKGCLLNLGELEDTAAQAAAQVRTCACMWVDGLGTADTGVQTAAAMCVPYLLLVCIGYVHCVCTLCVCRGHGCPGY